MIGIEKPGDKKRGDPQDKCFVKRKTKGSERNGGELNKDAGKRKTTKARKGGLREKKEDITHLTLKQETFKRREGPGIASTAIRKDGGIGEKTNQDLSCKGKKLEILGVRRWG